MEIYEEGEQKRKLADVQAGIVDTNNSEQNVTGYI